MVPLVILYIALLLAMVVAMVKYSEAVVAGEEQREKRRQWGWIYTGLWCAIVFGLFLYIGDEIDRNSVLLFFAVPAVFIATHLGILWLAMRGRR